MEMGMKKLHVLQIAWAFIAIVCLLSACVQEPDPTPTPTPTHTQPEVTARTDIPASIAPDNADIASSEPEDGSLASYIGKTVGDVLRDFGDGYMLDEFSGSTIIIYPEAAFLLGRVVKSLSDDMMIFIVIGYGEENALHGLCGAMTYPELAEAVGPEIKLDQPKFLYIELEEISYYSLEFQYNGYLLSYSWTNDPQTTASYSVYITKPDEFPLSDAQNAAMPSEPDTAPSDKIEYYPAEGWFDGVFSRFYVPEGFVRVVNRDWARGMGMHFYFFQNDELNMEISVFGCTFAALPIDVSEEYESLRTDSSVTYSTSGDGFYVVSGYTNDETIYYTRVDYNEAFYHSVEFTYPTDDADACEEILLAFLDNYTVG